MAFSSDYFNNENNVCEMKVFTIFPADRLWAQVGWAQVGLGAIGFGRNWAWAQLGLGATGPAPSSVQFIELIRRSKIFAKFKKACCSFVF